MKWIINILKKASLKRRAVKYSIKENPYKVILTQSCINSMRNLLKTNIAKGHEGIIYLGGLVDQNNTLITIAFPVNAKTTPGSFYVDSISMAKVIRKASDYSLYIVGQLHTHPNLAYHSSGDEKGAHICFSGYVSIVLPNYGKHLPSFKGAAIYLYNITEGFIKIDTSDLIILPDI